METPESISGFFPYKENRIFYQVDGAGPWLILCHALATNGGIWDGQIDYLRKNYSILRFDLPGHGCSPPLTARDYEFAGLAELTVALMDHLSIAKAHIAGVSVGGEVTQAAAALYPERFDKVVLVSTACHTDAARAELWSKRIAEVDSVGMAGIANASVTRWFSEKFAASWPATVETCRNWISATDPAGYIELAKVIQRMDLRNQNALIRSPPLVIYGEHDHNTGENAAISIAMSIPGAVISRVDGAGHFPQIEAASDFNQRLDAFLKS